MNYSKVARCLIVVGGVAMMVSTPVAAASNGFGSGTLKLSTGFDFTTGDYGDTIDTDITYIPFTAKYETLPWTFKATVPYIKIKGPGNVIGGGADGSIVVPGRSVAVQTNSGLGDVVATVAYELPTVSDRAIFEVAGKIKFGTADENEGLGTGEDDFSLQLDAVTTRDNFTPFGTVGYRLVGDPPAIELDNVFYFSLGSGYRLSERRSVGLIYDFRESSSPTADESQELVAYLSQRLQDPLSWLGYVSTGLSENAPDFNIGMQWTYTRRR